MNSHHENRQDDCIRKLESQGQLSINQSVKSFFVYPGAGSPSHSYMGCRLCSVLRGAPAQRGGLQSTVPHRWSPLISILIPQIGHRPSGLALHIQTKISSGVQAPFYQQWSYFSLDLSHRLSARHAQTTSSDVYGPCLRGLKCPFWHAERLCRGFGSHKSNGSQSEK